MAEQFAEGVVTLRAEGLDQIEAAAKKAADAAKKTADQISGIEAALKKQIAQFGLNSKEIAVWELRAKGATQAQINGIMNLTKSYERLQEKQKTQQAESARLMEVKAAVDAVTASLKKQVDQYGMTAAQIDLVELKAKGASAAELIRVRQLQKEYQALKDAKAASDKAAASTTNVNDTISGLQNSIARVGKSPDQLRAMDDAAQVAKLQAGGAGAAEIAEVMRLQSEHAKTLKSAGITSAIDAVTEALKKEAATYKMTADQIQIYELKQKGATEAELATVRKLQAERNQRQNSGIFGTMRGLAAGSSQITGMIGGLAALGGVKMAADALSNLSKKAIDLRDAYMRGEITSRQFYDQMARAVPIAGSLYAAVVDSTQAFQDYVSWAARSAGASEKFASVLESTATKAARAKAQLESIKNLRELSQTLREEGELIGKSSELQQLAASDVQAEDEKKRAKDELEAGLKKNPSPADEAKLRKAYSDATKQAASNRDRRNIEIVESADEGRRSDLRSRGIHPDESRLAGQLVDDDEAKEKIRDNERLANSEMGITDKIRDRIKALTEEQAAWRKKGFEAERAMLVAKNAPASELAKFDAAVKTSLEHESADKTLRRRVGVAASPFAAAGAAAGDLSSKQGDKSADRGRKAMDDFDKLVTDLQAKVDFKGMTEDQVAVEQFRRQGIPENQLAKLIELQAKQEKKMAGTQMLSAAGVQDYVQQAIGNAPMQQKTLQAAEKTASASEKLAASVKDGSIQVIVKSMPAQVATYG